MEGGRERQTGWYPHARLGQLTRWYPSEFPIFHRDYHTTLCTRREGS